MISVWRSMDAVREFAGADPSLAVVAPEVASLFDDYDRVVRHYELVVSSADLRPAR